MPAANVIGEVDANDRKRIKALIIRHLEEFLSPESLKSNPALTLNGSIAVKTLLKIKRDIIPDRQLLLEAISESSKFSLDPTANWVTIRQKKERNVLILREIPTDTPMAEIKAIFAVFTDLPEIKNIHSDIGNNWFITFKNQDDCMAAALKLSTEGRFKGHSLKVRVKANLAQAEQSSGRPVPPIVKSSYNSHYRTGPMYQSGRRGLPGARGLPGGRGLPGDGSYLRGGFPRTPYIEKNLAGDIEQRMPHRDYTNGINASRNYRRPGGREGYWPTSSEALLGGSPPSRRREMAYPPSMVIGSPRMGNFQNRPPPADSSRVPGVADYPGNFRLFSPESMREIIQKKYGEKIAPKPISLDSDEVRDIVNNKPKAILTLNEPGRTKVPGRGVQPVKREDTRKKDRQRRRKGDAGRSSGRPPHERGTSTQGAKPRGQKFQKRRSGRGRKEAGKY